MRDFRIDVGDDELADLHTRLADTRWPDAETPDDWSQGLPLAYARELRDYWLNDYDWREREAHFNSFPQYTTTIDGLDVHFIHRKSDNPDSVPLLITHGWPGSVVEFHKTIEPLANPTAYGGDAADSFDVICPSLPGYGFSGKPEATGWGVGKIAEVWDTLMQRIGYDRYFAQGGDWGAAVTTAIAMQDKGSCAGIHVNMPSAGPTQEARDNPTERDKQAFEGGRYYNAWGSGYSKQQSTRPQTLGYGLVDSPMGQATWIIEKFLEWTDCEDADGNKHPENVLSRDELLDNVMFYWLTAAGASSARLYWESFNRTFGGGNQDKITLPTGCSIFPKEIVPTPRSWAEQRYGNIVYWNELDRGGHFAAFEQPELFVNELRECFRLMR
ncbi:MAG: epoxide hydrolase [Gammaproteobacteria bacterium]|nr:epoxide hydrolase [Gammaproteobacteria bacterium]